MPNCVPPRLSNANPGLSNANTNSANPHSICTSPLYSYDHHQEKTNLPTLANSISHQAHIRLIDSPPHRIILFSMVGLIILLSCYVTLMIVCVTYRRQEDIMTKCTAARKKVSLCLILLIMFLQIDHSHPTTAFSLLTITTLDCALCLFTTRL
jgi:hypothetical protein